MQQTIVHGYGQRIIQTFGCSSYCSENADSTPPTIAMIIEKRKIIPEPSVEKPVMIQPIKKNVPIAISTLPIISRPERSPFPAAAMDSKIKNSRIFLSAAR